MDLIPIIEDLLSFGLTKARDELAKHGVTVDDEIVKLSLRVVSSLWRTESKVINAKELVVVDERGDGVGDG